MQIALYTGMAQPPANSSLSIAQDVTCPSANCTFPSEDGGPASFTTLTMCHSCRDVTASITSLDSNYTLVISDGRNVTMQVVPPYNDGHRSGVAFSMIASEVLEDDDIVSYPEGPWHRTSLSDFQGIAATNTNASCLGTDCDWRPFAFDCSLRPCVKTFAASVLNGVYREEELSQQYLHYLGNNLSGESEDRWHRSFQLAVNRTLLNGTWIGCDGAQNASGSYSVAVPQNEGPNPVPVLWYLPQCVYILRSAANIAISENFRNAIESGALTQYDTLVIHGDAWKKMLWNNSQISLDTVNKFSEGIAYAIGAQMRRAGEPLVNLTGYPDDVWSFAYGHGIESRSCIQVRWKWLSFLVILFLAEVAFLAIVMVMNRRSQWSGDWKSSTLPLILQNVRLYGGESTKQEGSVDDTSELYKAANGVRMSLCQVDGKWRLVADEPRST
ncbi:hypothetical protein NQ176_g7760 [Zarea fungicola]|uniref:Uncharacterized protein n=1 Tax=Zarea fungicola TaxID=93591 RepID=A0ACC1MYR9_9HYPO|nr:hypothetical protein NQ176_g7760 [Lecanicillium fungicola]